MINWEAVGAAGEVVGAIAVIATLFYLANQIKQSNKLARQSELNASMEQFSVLRIKVAGDEKMADLWIKGLADYRSLTDSERLRFDSIAAQQYWNFYHIWDRTRSGILENDIWEQTTKGAAANSLQAGLLVWWHQNNAQFPNEFVHELERLRSNDG
jgi:hypothetical protein